MRRPLLTAVTVACVPLVFAIAWSPARAAAPTGVMYTSTLKLPSGNVASAPDNYVGYLKLEEAAPELWGGAFVDNDVLVINVVGQTLNEAKSILAAAGVTRDVELRSSNVSTASLIAQKERVRSLVKGDPNVTSWGPNYADGSIIVEVKQDTASLRSSLSSLARPADPSVPAIITYGAQGVPTTNATRWFDYYPFWASHAIVLSSSTQTRACSAGFSLVQQSGAAWAITAAHCYIQRGAATSQVNRVQSSTSYTALGDIVSSSANSAGTYPERHGDVAVYKYRANSQFPPASQNDGRVYIGAGNATTGRVISGTTVLPQGTNTGYLRTAGSSGKANNNDNSLGEISPDWISLVNQDIYFSNSNATYTDLTVAEDASECTSGGDSGGAFYLQSGSSAALAVGIISGTNNQGAGPTNCRNYYTPVNLFYFSQAIQLG